MAFNLRNRNFLKLLDFTPAEIKYMLDLAADLKRAKYAGTEQPRLKGKNIALKRLQPVPVVLLKWLPMIRVLMPPIWALPDRRSV